MKPYSLACFLLIGTAALCVADVFEYTDGNGVVHFTDDPTKIPKAVRNSKQLNRTPSLTPQESKTVDVMMKLDKKPGQDIPVTDLPDFKKKVKEFGEGFREELGDPAEPKDPRLSTPESAWELFIEGLRKGREADIRAALLENLWNGGGFREFTKSQMRELSISFSKIKVAGKKQDEQTAVFEVRNEEGIYGSIEFINFYGNWKIRRF